MLRISQGLSHVVNVDTIDQIEPALSTLGAGRSMSTRSSWIRCRPATLPVAGESPSSIRMVG